MVISHIKVDAVNRRKAAIIVGFLPILSDTGPIISWKKARDKKYPEIKICIVPYSTSKSLDILGKLGRNILIFIAETPARIASVEMWGGELASKK